MSSIAGGLNDRAIIQRMFDVSAEQQILMRHEFRQHGALSVHVDLAGRSSHMDTCHRRGVPVRHPRMPELLGSHNYQHPDLHELRDIPDEIVLWR